MESINEIKINVILRHAAALALVGWYLMTPSITHPSYSVTILGDSSDQISTWTIEQSFDSARECEQVRQTIEQSLKMKTAMSAHELALLSAQCIATDDPRLKDTK